MQTSFELLDKVQIDQVHRASLAVLNRTGMRLGCPRMLAALRASGARVDEGAGVVRFPERLVEDAIQETAALLRAGRKLHLLNGVTSEKKGNGGILAKVSGGCEQYYDWTTRTLKPGDAAAFLRFVRLGELLPEVDFVGNPVVMKTDMSGTPIREGMRRVKTAALLAANTRKVGSMEVWDPREIDFLVELGVIARGSREAFDAAPCLVTAKETISPLHLDGKAADILVSLARKGLPCTVIPMPICGMSSPVSPLGGVILANAEILGVLTAVRAVVPQALVGGGTISGVLDMRRGTASFSAPEAILMDLALAEVYERLYGAGFLVGAGYTDAKVPDSQVVAEKTLKFSCTHRSGRHTYPLGLVNGGSAFCEEQALVDLEICRAIHSHAADLGGFEQVSELVQLVEEVGIRGTFLDQEHTLAHFRDNWRAELFEASGYISGARGSNDELYQRAHERAEKLLAAADPWRIDPGSAREIDRVVSAAERTLL
jgi:trimethylamine---corrinoid protein Co-methyltransferase